MNDDNLSVTIDELLERLRPEQLERVELDVRGVLEHFICPATVRDEEEFEMVFGDFYGNYLDHQYPGCVPERTAERRKLYASIARDHFAHQFGSQAFWTAAGDAVRNRNGGMLTLIERCREWIIDRSITTYIELRIDDYTKGKNAFDAHQQLVKAIVERFGKTLFPNESVPILPMFTDQARAFVITFARQRQRMSATFRK